MRFLRLLASLSSVLAAVGAVDNGLQKDVTWDNGSLLVNGERVIVMSGEFHYQRLPVPELWLDVFQKFKAHGMNTVSFYFFWSYHSASKGNYDFTTPGKDIQRLFDLAKEAGLYVIARPGPYCNAETNGGGLALWGSDGSMGSLRTSDETYYQAWSEWIAQVGAIIAKNQITNGGPVILTQVENELQETKYDPENTLVKYMIQIEDAFKEAGLIVPTTHNEKGFRSKSWSSEYNNVGGAVDIYGLDSYPGGMSCTNPDSGFNLPYTYYQWFHDVSPSQPQYLPEFEGGYFQPWGGYFYDTCQAEHSPEFADVFYKGIVAQRATLLNLYVAFGGTNWGHSGAPVVYTSYDYSAPLRETREIQDKFKQYKLLTLFTRVSQGLTNTVMETNGTGVATGSTDLWTWVLKNKKTNARFYLVQHNSTNSRSVTDFSITVSTSRGNVTIPDLQLAGRQSRWVVTDYPIGKETLVYSSAEVLTYGQSAVVFYMRQGQTGQFAFKGAKNITFKAYGAGSGIKATASGDGFTYTQAHGSTAVVFSNGVLAYLVDIPTAWTFFAPPTTSDPRVKPDEQVFVFGPHLVRSASVHGDTVSIVGDNANSTTIQVYAGKRANSISWNGAKLKTDKTAFGSLTASIPGAEDRRIFLPTLTDFRAADSLPEASPSYNDEDWIVANKTATMSPVKPLTLPVLFSSDYKFYTGAKVYRGYFSGRNVTSANITVQGGVAAGWNAWLNGKFVGYHPGNVSLQSTTGTLSFKGVNLTDKENVLTVVTDYTGHDQTSTGPAGVENPRGLLGAQLQGGTFSQWKIQGNAGGEKNIDPVRGPMNEGGLYGERIGWHLPGFDTSKWAKASPVTDGVNGAGIKWFTTTFNLNIDRDLDVPLGVEVDAPAGTIARALIFVNGYQYGKFVPHIGPQTRFPIPPGIINTRGHNTLSVALWAQTEAGAKLSKLQLIQYGKYQSGFGFDKIDGKALQPAWKNRSQHA
ncbi:uncharacterized protein N0V89_002152 [Didymosphaeria variabile]|uniref:beta-galactosidase n=1 Tax=Didymosphaeria variabile TaxID=1932322 RepID=A0A9W9CDB4_9PLEO|nr:uncharacterized protein N0V89_002152 [Didymosphaeria variabile]KAJ4357576.1 hypothetical protein N0V89_002152 [Didymosphaeria variabile]